MGPDLVAGYDVLLVLLSVAIAILASYTTLDLVGRITATQGRNQLSWLVSGAIALGMGIWAMHFIGMLAFRLPLQVHYAFSTVLVSILPAIIASGLALFLISRPRWSWGRFVGGGFCLGGGIAAMHYLGMAAMETHAMMTYTPIIVAASICIGIAVSLGGLFLVFRLREEVTPIWQRPLAALVMGAAIPTMHYTGMAAVQFIPTADTILTSELQPPENAFPLAIATTIGTFIILFLALLTAFFDRRLAAQAIYAQALQDSQAYLKTVLKGIQVGVLVIEKGTDITLSNPAVLELLGFETETALQQRWAQCIDPETSPEIDATCPNQDALPTSLDCILQKLAAQQPVQNAVIHIPSFDYPESTFQSSTALLVNAVPLTGFKKGRSQTVCTFSEITELKQAEARLQVSEAQFRELAEQEELLNALSTQIRQSLDLKTILQTTVSEIRQQFESDRALIYQFDDRWCGQVVLEDVSSDWPSTLGEAADDCFPQVCLDHYQGGGIRAINNIAEAGLDPAHFQFLQRLQVQANLIVPISVRNQLWGLLIVHQCGAPRTWYDSEGHLLSRLGVQLGIAIQQSDLYAEAEHSAQQAQAQAEELRVSEARLKQQAQTLQRNLAERQNLQLKLAQSERMSSLGQLVAGVAHEINNPVNFIHGNLGHVQDYTDDLLNLIELYQQQYPDPAEVIEAAQKDIELEFLQTDLVKVLKSMEVGTERICDIVRSLRNFSRMDEADFKTADIHEGLNSTLMILQHRLKAGPKHPEIVVVRDYGELPPVDCYPGQLNQVFMNILANAIDALETCKVNQTGQITIRTMVVDQWIQIAIADNGPGIPEAAKQRIFDPFFTTKPVGKGTGMGLSISHQIIVEKHQGKLDCHSSPETGTEFAIQIPMRV